MSGGHLLDGVACIVGCLCSSVCDLCAVSVLGVAILQVGFGRFAECDGYNPQLCKSE